MKILIATGGTAGHINPALAVAGYIREKYPETQFLFVGTKEKMESRLVPQAGFDFATVEISGFRRSMSPAAIKHNVKTVYRMFKSSFDAKKIIKDFNPDVAVGFGGYVSGPVIRTALKMGVKTAIHEQNAYPGVTNKALAKEVDAVMLTVSDAQKHLSVKNRCEVTGLPVRMEILKADSEISRKELGFDNRPLILSMGGSLGAQAINEAVSGLIERYCKEGKYNHIHAVGQSGKWVYDRLKESGVDLAAQKNIVVRDYIDDMDRCLAAADIVIGRAGASTLSEIQAAGKASILIPSPYVAENHQYHNAMALVNRGAALIIEEKDLTAQKLIETVDALAEDKEKLKSIRENAKKMAITDANEKIADIIMTLGAQSK